LSQHNIIGSEAFDTHQNIQIRRYPPRGATWRTYAVSALVGGAALFAVAAVLIYLAQTYLAR
jgi:hypothetical protein